MSNNKLVEKYPPNSGLENFLENLEKTVIFEGLCHPPCTRFADSIEKRLSIHKSICEQEEPWKYLQHFPGHCPSIELLNKLIKELEKIE